MKFPERTLGVPKGLDVPGVSPSKQSGSPARERAVVDPFPPASHSTQRLPEIALPGVGSVDATARMAAGNNAGQPSEPQRDRPGEVARDDEPHVDISGAGGGPPPPIKPPTGGAEIPEPPDDSEGRRQFIVQTSTGPVDLDRLLRNSRAEGEARIPTGVLREGDTVLFEGKEGPDTGERLAFKIQETEWRGLSMDETPTVRLTGRLTGLALLPEATDTDVVFQGSGYGKESALGDVLATDLGPYFRLADGGEYRAFGYGYVDTLRETDAGLAVRSPNQLDIEARRPDSPHNERLSQIEQLTNGLGYDIRSPSHEEVGRTRPVYSDERYEAEAHTRGAGDDELTVIDWTTKQWIKVRYRNAHGEDILQIGVADLSGRDVGELFQGRDLGETDVLSLAGVAITTFTTSNRYGLEAVNYYPSVQSAQDDLGIPPSGAGEEIDRPDIQIFPDGTINIPHAYPYSEVVEGNPGLEERIKSMISADTNSQGEMQITLGNRTIPLPDPRQLLNDLLSNIGFQEETDR